MTLRITDELREAISGSGDLSVRLYDAQSDMAYVVIPEALYERLCVLADGDNVLEPQYAHVAKLIAQNDIDDETLV